MISARVGLGFVIILSIICVATITGRALCIHLRIISFWITGSCSIGTSIPKSPLATMIAFECLMILSSSATASGFSILEMILAGCPFSSILLCRSIRSSAERTKDNAIQFTGCFRMNSRSVKSFSVKLGREILVFGRFTPLLEESTPPNKTLSLTVSILLVSTTSRTSFPSSTSTFSPGSTSLAKSS